MFYNTENQPPCDVTKGIHCIILYSGIDSLQTFLKVQRGAGKLVAALCTSTQVEATVYRVRLLTRYQQNQQKMRHSSMAFICF